MKLRVGQTVTNHEEEVYNQSKQQLSMYSFLRLLGIFIFLGWGVMFFTVPLDLNEKFEWVHVNGTHINGTVMGEFFFCLITVGIIYFGLLFLYFKKMWGRKRVLITLVCLSVVDGILFVFSL
ncbi:hypothetical protein NQ095_18135 [Rossellomorea sp. SC111]|uniref:hypothetical protein n=1 Tax=Rossellomorea sp. SC111 TaxID=2968985 RepID=UPI00215B7660|nr:hypothetical protein [Rossellomorea sp. SC111]MCR8850340.1 hypothetical protein [Rossellomorea sp. SC111]